MCQLLVLLNESDLYALLVGLIIRTSEMVRRIFRDYEA